jgi:hypothetical protein
MAKGFFHRGSALAAGSVMFLELGCLDRAEGAVAVGFRHLIDVVGAGSRICRHYLMISR